MDVITAIKKERGKYRVIVNDCEHVLVPISLMRERPLKEGQPLDLEEYDNWLIVRQYRFALDRAVGYLAARARSRREIEQKLLQAGYRPCTVEMVIYKLQRENLLDDADFARQWVESRQHHKLGRSRIAQELRRKGVSQDEAEEALSIRKPLPASSLVRTCERLPAASLPCWHGGDIPGTSRRKPSVRRFLMKL